MHTYFQYVYHQLANEREEQGWKVEKKVDGYTFTEEKNRWVQHVSYLSEITEYLVFTYPNDTFMCARDIFSNRIDPPVVTYHLHAKLGENPIQLTCSNELAPDVFHFPDSLSSSYPELCQHLLDYISRDHPTEKG